MNDWRWCIATPGLEIDPGKPEPKPIATEAVRRSGARDRRHRGRADHVGDRGDAAQRALVDVRVSVSLTDASPPIRGKASEQIPSAQPMASKSSKVFRVSGAMRAFGPPQLVLFCALSALAVLILSPRGVDQAEAAAEPLLGRPVRLLDMMGTAPHNVAEPHRPVPSASLASASYDATRITYLEGDMTMTPEDATPDI